MMRLVNQHTQNKMMKKMNFWNLNYPLTILWARKLRMHYSVSEIRVIDHKF